LKGKIFIPVCSWIYTKDGGKKKTKNKKTEKENGEKKKKQ